jgi:hypothetical protein
MAPATAGAVLFRSRPSAASPLPDRAQEGQLNSAGELTITSQPADFLLCAVAGCHAYHRSPPHTSSPPQFWRVSSAPRPSDVGRQSLPDRSQEWLGDAPPEQDVVASL